MAAATPSRTQLRRLHRRHSKEAYFSLHSKLASLLVPVPAGVIASDLEAFRASVYPYVHEDVRSIGRCCAGCGLWEPDSIIAPSHLPVAPACGHAALFLQLAERSKLLAEQVSLIRSLHQSAFLSEASSEPEKTITPIDIAASHGIPAAEAKAEAPPVDHVPCQETFERNKCKLAPYLNFQWQADTVPLSAYPDSEVRSLLSYHLPLEETRAILFARHIKGFQAHTQPTLDSKGNRHHQCRSEIPISEIADGASSHEAALISPGQPSFFTHLELTRVVPGSWLLYRVSHRLGLAYAFGFDTSDVPAETNSETAPPFLSVSPLSAVLDLQPSVTPPLLTSGAEQQDCKQQ